jgi:predicted phosphoribosyltransferase
MRFKDRIETAKLLAEKLKSLWGKNPIVLGIPRGAIPMARLIADELGGDLDVVLIHKISAPLQPELAIGSVGVSGEAYRYPKIEEWGVSEEHIQSSSGARITAYMKRVLSWRDVP